MLNERQIWLDTLDSISRPVLEAAATHSLVAELAKRTAHPAAPLEAFARTLAGISPWLELELTEVADSAEKQLQTEYRQLAHAGLAAITNPDTPDCLFLTPLASDQRLVDSAFLASALLRSPNQLIKQLAPKTKKQLIRALKTTRTIIHHDNNWILFSAMVEAALSELDSDFDLMRIDYAYTLMNQWYLGDGFYGDGQEYTFDYYNSFVIHPFLVDLTRHFPVIATNAKKSDTAFPNKVLQRATRYAQLLEMQINRDGTFPVYGRSMTYRFGCFHLLSQAALHGFLPKNLAPNQVRSGLTQTILTMTEQASLFDQDGWLRVGIQGEQKAMAEPYINVGSCYLATAILLPLGLSEETLFWSGPTCDWTAKQIWSGQQTVRDQAYHEHSDFHV